MCTLLRLFLGANANIPICIGHTCQMSTSGDTVTCGDRMNFNFNEEPAQISGLLSAAYFEDRAHLSYGPLSGAGSDIGRLF